MFLFTGLLRELSFFPATVTMHLPAQGPSSAKEIPAHADDRICELPLSNFDFEFETRGPLLTCRARKQEAKTGRRSGVRDRADAQCHGEEWPSGCCVCFC